MIEDFLLHIRGIYFDLPPVVRNSIGTSYRALPLKARLGAEFAHFSRLLKEARDWSAQQILDYQFQELGKTLNSAYEHVPFYRRRFLEYGVSPADLKAPEDLVRFPTITKTEIKENFADLINPEVPSWKRNIAATGGSTAEPLKFYQTKGLTRGKEKAFIYEGWSRVGYQPGDRAVQLKGRTVGNPEAGVYWEYEPIQNFLEMDSNYLSEDRIPAYLDAMRRFRGRFLIGYPSSLYLIAKYVRDAGAEIPEFEAVMCASENVYDWQRRMLEEVFDCRVFSHYGHSEMVLLGMEAIESNDLLFFPQYGFLELLDDDDNSVTRPGGRGELVGTSFHNHLMPFIRYRTQDVGIRGLSSATQPSYPVLSDVEGRLQEFIVTRDERLISICVMGAAHFDTLDNVSATQYYQEEPGRVEFRVVPRTGFGENDRAQIYRAVSEKLGKDVELTIREVDAIERTRSGKHMMIIQKVPLEVLEGSQDLVLKESSTT